MGVGRRLRRASGGDGVRRRPLRHNLATSVVVLALSGALILLGGCGEEGTDPAALDGTAWELVRWSASDMDPADFTITATFADGQVSGTSAVNSYGGPYTTGPGDDFSTGDLASTMMAGPEPDMRAETTYLTLLRAAASFKLEGDTLTLYDEGGGESLVYAAAEG